METKLWGQACCSEQKSHNLTPYAGNPYNVMSYLIGRKKKKKKKKKEWTQSYAERHSDELSYFIRQNEVL